MDNTDILSLYFQAYAGNRFINEIELCSTMNLSKPYTKS